MELTERDLSRFHVKWRLDLKTWCWVWTGAKSHGYGMFWLNRKLLSAHRLSYQFYVGEILEGLELDHLCRNRACINPDHLEPVSGKVNLRRGAGFGGVLSRSFTHCPKGHPYTGANLYVRPNGNRGCRACKREQIRAWYQRQKPSVG